MTIEAYRKIWPQRLSAASIESEEEMERLIAIELKDELTHPRVRKSTAEKLALAVERINAAPLETDEQQTLIETYKKIAAQLD
ncbi:hypothetical protein DHX103_00600 [Planococcus sp. X10-3]|uniref:hypothetical protein n=1 Tax=Planococcus sp. X10-3 TaxID=3061240 RepID=UPI003BB09FE2